MCEKPFDPEQIRVVRMYDLAWDAIVFRHSYDLGSEHGDKTIYFRTRDLVSDAMVGEPSEYIQDTASEKLRAYYEKIHGR